MTTAKFQPAPLPRPRCQFYSGAQVLIGACKAGVPYADVGHKLGKATVVSLPCLDARLRCPARVWETASQTARRVQEVKR